MQAPFFLSLGCRKDRGGGRVGPLFPYYITIPGSLTCVQGRVVLCPIARRWDIMAQHPLVPCTLPLSRIPGVSLFFSISLRTELVQYNRHEGGRVEGIEGSRLLGRNPLMDPALTSLIPAQHSHLFYFIFPLVALWCICCSLGVPIL
jgi:hypothetical protein